MAWRPYAACCHTQALDTASGFCGECGRTLLRCMAFQECASLVSPGGPCPVCIAPSLELEKGAVTQVTVGDRLSIPLVYRNASKTQRPLLVSSVVLADGDGGTANAMVWEQIGAQEERGIAIETAAFPEAGSRTLSVFTTFASRHKGREEQYAFSTGIGIRIEQPEDTSVSTTINVNSATDNAIVNLPINQQAASRRELPRREAREALVLQRAERYEIEHGIRGYADSKRRVPRDVAFAFRGFPPADHPRDGTRIGQRGALACGRSGIVLDAQNNPVPNDLALRVHDPRSGALDEAMTTRISRYLFDLFVMNDRLCIQARGASGVSLDGKALGTGEIRIVTDGARIEPLPGHKDRLSLEIRFLSDATDVETIAITRQPEIRPPT